MKFEKYKSSIWMNPAREEVYRVFASEFNNEIDIMDTHCLQEINWLYYCLDQNEMHDITDKDISNISDDFINYVIACFNMLNYSFSYFPSALNSTIDFYDFCKESTLYTNKLKDVDDKLLLIMYEKLMQLIEQKEYSFQYALRILFSWFDFRVTIYKKINFGCHPLDYALLIKFYNTYNTEFADYRENHFEDTVKFANFTIFFYCITDFNKTNSSLLSLTVRCNRDALVAAQANGYAEFVEPIKKNIINIKNRNVDQVLLITDEMIKSEGSSSSTVNNGVRENLKEFIKAKRTILSKKGSLLQNSVADFEKEIDINTFNIELKKCRILLLTANDCEDKVITRLLYEENGNKPLLKQVFNGYLIHVGTLSNINVAHVHLKHSGSSSDDGSEDAVRFIADYFMPTLLISIGVAYGIDCEKQSIGDVLISESIIDVDKWSKKTDGQYKLEAANLYCSDSQIMASWGHMLDTKNYMNDYNWYFGTFISKSTVINDTNEKSALLEAALKYFNKTIIGGEMEGCGIARACKKLNIPRWLIAKAICDWGEEKNSFDIIAKELDLDESNDTIKDSIQAYAAENAFTAIKELLLKAPSVLNG